MSADYQRIRFGIEGGVATLVLDNPAKRNAFDPTMRVEMAEVVRQVQRDPQIRALVLTGAGAHFCSGGDLGNIAASGLDNGGWRRRLTSLHDWLKDLMLLDKPVVAAVDGAVFVVEEHVVDEGEVAIHADAGIATGVAGPEVVVEGAIEPANC